MLYILYPSMDDEELVTEGANLDARAIVKKAKKEFTQNLKLCKKEIKAKNYKEAKSYTKKMKASLKDYESQIKKLESTVGSVILGYFATSLRDLCNLTVVTLDTKVAAKTTNPAAKVALHTAGTVGGLLIAPVSMIKALITSVEEIMGLIKGIQEEKNLPDKINFYKQKMLTILGKLMKVVDDMDKLIDKKAAEDK